MRSRPARAIHEASFHRWLQRHLPAGRSGLLPLGDDAAALSLGRGRALVLTTDALVEGTHCRSRSGGRIPVGRRREGRAPDRATLGHSHPTRQSGGVGALRGSRSRGSGRRIRLSPRGGRYQTLVASCRGEHRGRAGSKSGPRASDGGSARRLGRHDGDRGAGGMGRKESRTTISSRSAHAPTVTECPTARARRGPLGSLRPCDARHFRWVGRSRALVGGG
jgi:hypothetical protein